MPGLSGLEVAAQLESDAAPLLVFVTAFDEHAIKRLRPERDRLSIEALRPRPARQDAATPARAPRRGAGTLRRADRERADPLQRATAGAARRAAAAHRRGQHSLAGGRRQLRARAHRAGAATCCAARSRTCWNSSANAFVRIHKSTAVNLAEVATLTPLFKGDHEVRLRSGSVLRLSRRFKDAALRPHAALRVSARPAPGAPLATDSWRSLAPLAECQERPA